ncbi:hypothetical protein [Mucilaginibacter sp.]
MEKFYKGYFQNLVTQSKHLTGFAYINDRYDLTAFDTAIKAVGGIPALLLEQYNYDVVDAASGRNYMKSLQGQFNILIKSLAGDQSSIEDCRIQGEMIADLFIARMRRDFDGAEPITLNDGSVSNPIIYRVKAKCEAIGPINGDYYGVACLFTWETQFLVQTKAADWNDIT